MNGMIIHRAAMHGRKDASVFRRRSHLCVVVVVLATQRRLRRSVKSSLHRRKQWQDNGKIVARCSKGKAGEHVWGAKGKRGVRAGRDGSGGCDG